MSNFYENKGENMKKLKVISVMLSILLLCICTMIAVSAVPRKVYVSADGSDANSGTSAASPVKTLDKAFKSLGNDKEGTIVFVGKEYSVGQNYSFPDTDGKITITSEMSGDLKYSGTLSINSDMVIENISFSGSSTPIFVCNGHNVTFGDGIVNKSNTYIVGGANLTESSSVSDGTFSEDYTIEINSGEWVNFFGGNRRAVGKAPTCTITADITIKVDGAKFKITTDDMSKNQNNLSGMNSTTGKLTLEVKSGEFLGNIVACGRGGSNAKALSFAGEIDIKLLGGKFANAKVFRVCQEASASFDGSCHVEISDNVQLGYKEINAEGCTGKATIDAPAAVLDKCKGFARDVYVSDTGSDTNGGTGASDAYKTLKKAADTVASDGGNIIVAGKLTLDGETILPDSKEKLSITGDGNAVVALNGKLQIGTDTTFDNISFEGEGVVFANGHVLTMESAVKGDGNLGVSASAISGKSSSGGQVILKGGEYHYASAGSIGGLLYSGDGIITGAESVSNTLVSVEGAKVAFLYVSGGNDISGSCVVSISSGEITTGVYGIFNTNTAKLSGTAVVEIVGGTINGKIEAVASPASGTAEGTFKLSLLGGYFKNLESVSGRGFNSSELKASDEIIDTLNKLDVGPKDFTTTVKEKVIFVSDGGKGDGKSAQEALGSLKAAYEAAGADGEATIVVCGPLTVSGVFEAPKHDGKITFVSRYAGTDYRRTADAKFILADQFVSGGDVFFNDITVSTDGKTRIFFGNGYPMEFGEGVACDKGNGGSYPYIFGGSNKSGASVNGVDITVSGGSWHCIQGGNRNIGAYVLGDVSVKINGGYVSTYVTGTGRAQVKGNIKVEINGGSIEYGVYGIYASSTEQGKVEGNIEIHLNGGKIKGKVAASKYDKTSSLDGKYTCYINGSDLDAVTDIRGAAEFSRGNSESEYEFGHGISFGAAVEGTVSLQNPICTGADPWVTYHDGFYYMALARGGSIEISKAATLADIGKAEGVKVWIPSNDMGLSGSLWSPELHYFSAEDFGEEHEGWYLYIATTPADDKDNNEKRRCYALKALTDDPQGIYGSPEDGRANAAVQIKMDKDNTNWNIGPSVFRIDGKIYMTWTGRVYTSTEHRQNLNIAEMVNPYTLNLDRHGIICWPTEKWEKYGATYSGATLYPEVVEGATAVYGADGSVYCIYSASGYWTDNYALAQLKFKGGDPTDINNWEKSKQPIFTQNNFVYGPGHASYVRSADGATNYFVYHGYPTSAKEARYVYVEEFKIDEKGVHLGSGQPADISKPIEIAKNPLPLSAKLSGFEKQQEPSDPATDTTTGTDTTVAEPQKKNGTLNTVIIIAAVAVIVAAAAVVVVVLVKKPANKATKKEDSSEDKSE